MIAIDGSKTSSRKGLGGFGGVGGFGSLFGGFASGSDVHEAVQEVEPEGGAQGDGEGGQGEAGEFVPPVARVGRARFPAEGDAELLELGDPFVDGRLVGG